MNKIKFNATILFTKHNYASVVHHITQKIVLPSHGEVEFENIHTMQTTVEPCVIHCWSVVPRRVHSAVLSDH